MNDLVKRFQVPAYSDCWMRGDRFGNLARVTIGKTGQQIAHILLDKSDKIRKFLLDDCQEVQS